MLVRDMPKGLLNYSWAGSLPRHLYGAQRSGVLLVIALAALLGLLSGGGVFLVTGNPEHFLLAIPFSTWPVLIGLPVLYGMSVRDVRILHQVGEGIWELDFNHWWKSDIAKLDENKATYEKGRRVFWLKIPPGEDTNEAPLQLQYIDPEEVKFTRTQKETVDSSAVYGLKGYVASGSAYVIRKSRSLSDAVKLGVIAAVIGGELIMLFMLVGNITNGDS